MNNPIRYVALLRGINVGGNKKVPMQKLQEVFASLGLTEIKTILASGNVVFTSTEDNSTRVTEKLEASLRLAFGFEIPVLLRTQKDIQQLIKSDPFRAIRVTPDTRLYVSFVSEKITPGIPIPYESPEKDLRILSASETEVCSAIVLNPKHQTTDLMKIIEKNFGKKTTTRNWNTVQKISGI